MVAFFFWNLRDFAPNSHAEPKEVEFYFYPNGGRENKYKGDVNKLLPPVWLGLEFARNQTAKGLKDAVPSVMIILVLEQRMQLLLISLREQDANVVIVAGN